MAREIISYNFSHVFSIGCVWNWDGGHIGIQNGRHLFVWSFLASGKVWNLILMFRYMFWGTQNTLPWLYRGFQYWKGKKHRWRPYWNPKWLPLHVLILLIWASGRIYCMILGTKYMFWGLKNTFPWLSRGLEYWPYKKPRWQPFWNPKWLPCEVIFYLSWLL